jgi:hypothetical protein
MVKNGIKSFGKLTRKDIRYKNIYFQQSATYTNNFITAKFITLIVIAGELQ